MQLKIGIKIGSDSSVKCPRMSCQTQSKGLWVLCLLEMCEQTESYCTLFPLSGLDTGSSISSSWKDVDKVSFLILFISTIFAIQKERFS